MCHYCDIEEITPELRRLLEPGEEPPKGAFLANHTRPVGAEDLKWAAKVIKERQELLQSGTEKRPA